MSHDVWGLSPEYLQKTKKRALDEWGRWVAQKGGEINTYCSIPDDDLNLK